MRIGSARDLGLYIKDQRSRQGKTQAQLAVAAGVSRRWLSALEGGKDTVELGLALKVIHALELMVDVIPDEISPGGIDLDEHLRNLGRLG